MLKTITLADIRGFNPCYDPARYAPEDWTGTALDVLKAEHVPAEDRLWLVLRPELIDNRTLRLFAVWCARQALAFVESPDERSVAVCDIAERYANGQATAKELAAARDAASTAARDAASTAASVAAWDAASTAASVAASDAARAAARDAASVAAWAAASAAARDAQIAHLISMIEDK